MKAAGWRLKRKEQRGKKREDETMTTKRNLWKIPSEPKNRTSST